MYDKEYEETKISRRYEVVYKSYASNLQKLGFSIALTSVLIVMIIGALWNGGKTFDGWRLVLLCASVLVLLASLSIGVYSEIRDSIDYRDGYLCDDLLEINDAEDCVLVKIDRMYTKDPKLPTFLSKVLDLNYLVLRSFKIMSFLTLVAVVLLVIISAF